MVVILFLVLVFIALPSSLAEGQEQKTTDSSDEGAFIKVYAKPDRIASGTTTSVVVITDRDFDQIVLMNESSRITDTQTAPVENDGTQKIWVLSTQKISGNYGRTFTVRAYTGEDYVEAIVKIVFVKNSNTVVQPNAGAGSNNESSQNDEEVAPIVREVGCPSCGA